MITKDTTIPHVYVPEDVPYDAARSISVIIIGAGIGGIATSVLLQNKVPNLNYTVVEKNAGVGGTWWENRYPGVRCDVASHSYQLSFEPNPSWSEFYARGDEIRQYYEDVARKHRVYEHIKFRHEVTQAMWSAEDSQWHVQVRDLESGTVELAKANFLVSAAGRLNSAQLPAIEDLDQFAGSVVHTAAWDASLDYKGKRVAVIGNGASGMQVIPNILADVEHLGHFARSRTWVSAYFRSNLLSAPADNPGGHQYTQEEVDRFTSDTKAHLAYRKALDATFHAGFQAYKAGSVENAAVRTELTALMSERIQHDPVLLEKLMPEYAPGCKRLTPAPGYLESLRNPKVNYVTDKIVRATPSGLVTADGKEHAVDVIIAATGFPDSFVPRFPVVGRSGVRLQDLWSPASKTGPGYPETYFGIMVPRFPNLFFVLQAQGTALGGTVPVHCEQTATYIARCIRKIQSQSYSALEPSQDATDDFNAVVDGFFADKVSSTDSCTSWWKTSRPCGRPPRMVISWPGSGHHKWDISRDPRWEDFVFHRRTGTLRNRFHYFGNGMTRKELSGDLDSLTSYLNEAGHIDLRTIHESWTDQV
ncbi:hypothetical protein A1O3_08632 [Capronia epimyces CBS 606.96]|uniref:L-ornithine N(5)-monooxygenase n=1 Tax=Capronia epimyces CBS 606.96 TaxID=1182542 RepID=W9XQ68_9EURO|nr:uncharacterized protein A1O3_08632 [Capronia epimyces CBS 606.96]EXJ79131.1 hypothetical protein A1O3_08632 [Capronia epimyces CBS 606.96]